MKKGSHHSEETKRKRSLQQKRMWQNISYRKRMCLAHEGLPGNRKGKHCSKATKEKISIAQKKLWQNPTYKKKQLKSIIEGGFRDTPKRRKQLSISLKGRHFSKKWKRKISLAKIKLWQNPFFRKKMIRALYKGIKRKLTKPERRLRNGLNKMFPGEYKYVGNWEIWIGRRCPDFINVNGQKKIIELFGDYWHSEERTGRTKQQEENQRVNHFARYGFRTLIVWECELKNIKQLKRKLVEFHNA